MAERGADARWRPGPAARAAAAFALLLFAAAGCVSDPPTVTPVEPTRDPFARITPDAGVATYRAAETNTQLALGFERLGFRLFDEQGAEITDGTVETVFYVINGPNGETIRKASGPALFFGATLPGGGRWVVYTSFDASGPWSMDITATRPDGRKGLARLNVTILGRSDIPFEGRPAPATDTPHLADGVSLADLSSADDPDERLYTLSVADAIASGRPSLVLFASPGGDPASAGRAMLGEVRRVADRTAGRMNVIHIESRDRDDATRMSATARAWGLDTDPWLFLLDARGYVDSRIEGPVDADEIGLLLDRVLDTP